MKACLIVDDSRVVRTVARRILQEMSFETIEAGNGQEALDICAKSMPDAILLDWNMPVMDGMEFLTALRALEGAEQPKVIFCTTENEFDRIQKAIVAGADEYIMKPFDAEILHAKFAQVGLVE